MTWTHSLPNLQILKNADIRELDEGQTKVMMRGKIYIIHLTVTEIFLIFLIMMKHYNNFFR